ncbi:MAG: LysM peptidoglycan-binding domain-containing protein [Acidiferrobacteraceae bacterium]
MNGIIPQRPKWKQGPALISGAPVDYILNVKMKILSPLILIAVLLMPAVHADTVRIRAHAPHRYTVVRGDTLWSISAHFLKDPWQWPAIWNRNHQIKNPRLIYPGDVIVLSYNQKGQPVLRVLRTERLAPARHRRATEMTASGSLVLPEMTLKPAVRSRPYVQPIPTIKPDAILPFLTRLRVVTPKEMRNAPYVLAGTDPGRSLFGTFDTIYANHLGPHPATEYLVFKSGPALRTRQKKLLGYEGLYLGRVRLLHAGEPARLEIVSARRAIRPGDRLFPAPPPRPIPYYYPRPPRTNVHGEIISALGSMADAGPGAVVAIDLGRKQGLQRGDVLQVLRHQPKPVRNITTGRTERLPDERSGLLMVFRPFAHISYALVMEAKQPIRIGDDVATP